ncbi:cysteine hydrolase family protein [Geodermatophilus sp. SYSU D00708]
MHPAPIPPDEAVVLVVDVQNDYCHPEGTLGRRGVDCASALAAVERIGALLPVARAAGVPVLHVHTQHSRWTDTPGWRRRGQGGTTIEPETDPIVAAGTWGAEPYGDLVADGDFTFVKHRYSAFAFTPLDLVLSALARPTLVLAGLTSDVCVRATGVDAVSRGHRAVLVGDATATVGVVPQATACAEFAATIGPVVPSADLLSSWAVPAGSAAGAP